MARWPRHSLVRMAHLIRCATCPAVIGEAPPDAPAPVCLACRVAARPAPAPRLAVLEAYVLEAYCVYEHSVVREGHVSRSMRTIYESRAGAEAAASAATLVAKRHHDEAWKPPKHPPLM
jgi:hypothetical protein